MAEDDSYLSVDDDNYIAHAPAPSLSPEPEGSTHDPSEDLPGGYGENSENGADGADDSNSESSSNTMTGQSSDSIISKYLKGKKPEWDVPQPSKPLTLLDLPVDVLCLIVKEITHTNDLTSLALTNSTLHNLAVPHIYARFDIVWPDAHMSSSDTKSVDALTYGLSTLCLGSSFARTTRRMLAHGTNEPSGPLTKFAGNDYAKYTRKFSLGNGPPAWVAEYMINKESGKMLGTLVALVVAKMINLETFIWDMPTGVLSDIFMAMSSLPEKNPNGNRECKLERVWIRWHDNSDPGNTSSQTVSPGTGAPTTSVVPTGSTLTPVGIALPSSATHPSPQPAIEYSESRVEYPTFSVLPPLKSLTVLDIDELAYLDEMSVLIERSKDKLQELRVGISNKATLKDFVQTWDGEKLQQVDHSARWPGESTIGERRLGGVLGVLVGRIYDIRRKPSSKTKGASPSAATENEVVAGAQAETSQANPLPTTNALGSVPLGSAPPLSDMNPPLSVNIGASGVQMMGGPRRRIPKSTRFPRIGETSRKRLEGKLKLKTLELERIPLSMHVCSKAFDWTVLTTLTILECAQHENLWKLLKRQFAPSPAETGLGIKPSAPVKPAAGAPLQYHLQLRHLQTDITSPALIAFIRETLAPNSLETLFLQDRRRGAIGSAPPPVTIDAVFKGAIKRHKSSLKKLLLDSAAKPASNGGPENASQRWRSWCLTTEIMLYITSGRMSSLKELAASIEHKDWHTFLTRLPNVPQLRSLYFPYVSDHRVSEFDSKELALQIADIITLRPEIQICYVGLSTKCFEILETRPSDSPGSALLNGNSGPANPVSDVVPNHNGVIVEDAADDDENTTDGDNDEDDDDDETEDEDDGTPTSPTDQDETQSEHSEGGDSDGDSFVEPDGGRTPRLRLREILFYDDKVAIFKARHGKL